MQDIDYFINIEKEYNKKPKLEMDYIDGVGFEYPYEPLYFLREHQFERYAEFARKQNGICGLTDVEWLMFYCFTGRISGYFRDDIYIYNCETPDVVKEMQIVLDSVISKAPKFSGDRLYRFLKPQDKTDFEKGDIYSPSHSVTTTTEDWEQLVDMYIITPLPKSKTKAHSLYELYNHGNETQVNFERGTNFIITNIQEQDGLKRIYMNEEE